MQAALNSSVLDRVTSAIGRTTYIGDRVVTPETRLVSDLALDRFARLKLAVHLEEVFDLELSDEVLEKFVTIANIVKYIGGHYFRDIEPLWSAEAA